MQERRTGYRVGFIACTSILLICFVLFTLKSSDALVIISDTCTWPAEWPKQLDEIRKTCRTIEVAAGNQENIYEIFVTDRDIFEKLWPVIVSVKTNGAPLRLKAIGVHSDSSFLVDGQPTIRIYAPAYSCGLGVESGVGPELDSKFLQPKTSGLCASPPWPDELIGPNGELPEYVVAPFENGLMKWKPADPANGLTKGFLYRARIELELVIDGQIIDLNRIHLLANTPILDKRFAPESGRVEN